MLTPCSLSPWCAGNYGVKKHEVVIPRTVMKEVQRKIQSSAAAETAEKDKEKRPAAAAKTLHSSQSTRKLSDDLKIDHPSPAEHESKHPDDGAESSHNSASSQLSEVEGSSPAPATPKTPVAPLALPSRPALLRVVSSTFFTQDDGGLCSVDPMSGREGNEVYYLGIIDILQRYNAMKRMEHGVKALTHDAASVSCAPPSFYAERFLNSIGQRMLGVDESLAWVGASALGRGDSALSLEEMMEIGRQSSDEPP